MVAEITQNVTSFLVMALVLMFCPFRLLSLLYACQSQLQH